MSCPVFLATAFYAYFVRLIATNEDHNSSETFLFQEDEERNVESNINKLKTFVKPRLKILIFRYEPIRFRQEASKSVHALKRLQQHVNMIMNLRKPCWWIISYLDHTSNQCKKPD